VYWYPCLLRIQKNRLRLTDFIPVYALSHAKGIGIRMKKIFGLLMSFALVLSLVAPVASAKTKENNDAFKDKSMHVQIVLFDGFDLLDALAPYEVFAAAGIYSGGAVT
jgi:hypothetical protein